MAGLRVIGVRLSATLLCSLSIIASAWAAAGPPVEPSVSDKQLMILAGLGIMTTVLVIIGAILIYRLREDALTIALKDANAAKRYYELPFGVPEGTVRGFVSMLVIIMGLAFLVVQEPLGIESSEAIAGFISAVIAFYFVTRTQAQAQSVMEDGANALRQASQGMQNARVMLTQAASPGLRKFFEATNGLGETDRQTSAPTLNALFDAAWRSLDAAVTHRTGEPLDDRPLGDGGYKFADEILFEWTGMALAAISATLTPQQQEKLSGISPAQVVKGLKDKTGAGLALAIANAVAKALK